jgi:hypothetical protein
VSQDLVTIPSQLVKEWVFLVQWQDLATILLMPLKVWHAQALQGQVHQDQEPDQKGDQIAPELDQVAHHAQVLQEQNLDLVAVHPEADFQLGDQPVAAAAASAAEPLELLVRAEQEDKVKRASPSVLNEKSLSKEVSRVWVAQLCRVGMEPR